MSRQKNYFKKLHQKKAQELDDSNKKSEEKDNL